MLRFAARVFPKASHQAGSDQKLVFGWSWTSETADGGEASILSVTLKCLLHPGVVRRLSHGRVCATQGPRPRWRDPRGRRRDTGPAGETVRGHAGRHQQLLHPPEEPLRTGSQEGAGRVFPVSINTANPEEVFKLLPRFLSSRNDLQTILVPCFVRFPPRCRPCFSLHLLSSARPSHPDCPHPNSATEKCRTATNATAVRTLASRVPNTSVHQQ